MSTSGYSCNSDTNLAQYFRYLDASYMFMTEMDKLASVSYASANTTYGVLEISGIVNVCQNIMHLLSH